MCVCKDVTNQLVVQQHVQIAYRGNINHTRNKQHALIVKKIHLPMHRVKSFVSFVRMAFILVWRKVPLVNLAMLVVLGKVVINALAVGIGLQRMKI